MSRTIRKRVELHITSEGEPGNETHLLETLLCRINGGKWIVTDKSRMIAGTSESLNRAVLFYLAGRLGVPIVAKEEDQGRTDVHEP